MSMGSQPKKEGFVRTTIYLPSDLHNNAKMMAVLTGKPISQIIRVALTEKIKQLSENGRALNGKSN